MAAMLRAMVMVVASLLAGAQLAAAQQAWSVTTTFGNHRYAVPVPAGASSAIAFTAEIEWRRTGNSTSVSDGLVLFCAAGGTCDAAGDVDANAGMLNATVLNSSRLSAFVAIDARQLAGSSVVHVYYMPFSRNAGSAFGEQVTYLTNADRNASSAASAAWHRELPAAVAAGVTHLGPAASTYEARTPFDAYTELERTATAAEIAGMLSSAAATQMGEVLVFPEPRERQIRMTWRHPQSPTLPDLPHSWAVTGPALSFHAGAFDKGEFATFQLGLFAAKAALAGVRIDSSVGAAGFAGPAAAAAAAAAATASIIPQSALNCFNLEGVDDRGVAFNRSYAVPHLQTGALWFGLAVPDSAAPGSYSGSIGLILMGAGGKETRHTVAVTLQVTSSAAYRSGDRNLTKMTRTRWIDSRVGETDVPAKRHSALIVDKTKRTVQTWSMLVSLSESGLPAQLTRTGEGITKPVELLSGPFEFAVDGKANCEALVWDNTAAIASWTGRCTGSSSAAAAAAAGAAAAGVVQTVRGSLDADGTMMYDIALTAAATTTPTITTSSSEGGEEEEEEEEEGFPAAAAAAVTLKDVELVMPMAAEAVPYTMGLGRQGERAIDWDWRWWVGQTEPGCNNWGPPISGTGYQNYMLWLGDVDQGMRFKLLGDGDNWLSALHTVSAAAQIPAWGGVPLPPSPTPTPVGGQTCGGKCSIYTGGVSVRKGGSSTNVTAFRGAPLKLSAVAATTSGGEQGLQQQLQPQQAAATSTSASFKFELLLTPCVKLNTTSHFGDQGRYFQYSSDSHASPLPNATSDPVELAKEFISSGVKVVNVHQGVPVLNPFINYPFEPAATDPLTTLAKVSETSVQRGRNAAVAVSVMYHVPCTQMIAFLHVVSCRHVRAFID